MRKTAILYNGKPIKKIYSIYQQQYQTGTNTAFSWKTHTECGGVKHVICL